MIFSSRALLGFVGGILLCGLLAGCGGKNTPYPVKGTLTKGGQPLKGPTAKEENLPPSAGEPTIPGVEMKFYRYEGDKRPDEKSPSFLATVYTNGNFEVPGPKGNGLPAGKYLVTIRQMSVKPGTLIVPQPDEDHPDKLGGAFSLAKSPITVEVKGTTEDLKIELNDYKGKKPAH